MATRVAFARKEREKGGEGRGNQALLDHKVGRTGRRFRPGMGFKNTANGDEAFASELHRAGALSTYPSLQAA